MKKISLPDTKCGGKTKREQENIFVHIYVNVFRISKNNKYIDMNFKEYLYNTLYS